MTKETEIHFDVSQIVSIRIIDKRQSMYTWEPERQEVKTFFGLITKVKYRREGFYTNYEEWLCYTKKELAEFGYIFEDNVAYDRPILTIYFKNKNEMTKKFDTFEEASTYAAGLKYLTGKKWEILKY